MCAVPSTPFFARLPPSMTLARDVSCPQWLRPLGLAMLLARNVSCPFLAETAGACCQMQLARDVSCPRWPRPLGLAVHTVSLPAMSNPLWCDRHSACCEKISSSPAMSVPSLAVTAVGLLLNVLVARQRCLCPRGATAIWLATCNNIFIYLVARPQSCALVGCHRCWLPSQTW